MSALKLSSVGIPGAQRALFDRTSSPRLFDVADRVERMKPRANRERIRENSGSREGVTAGETESPLDALAVQQEPSLPGQMFLVEVLKGDVTR